VNFFPISSVSSIQISITGNVDSNSYGSSVVIYLLVPEIMEQEVSKFNIVRTWHSDSPYV